jgi:membrane fusion protein, copper/silver efflux system
MNKRKRIAGIGLLLIAGFLLGWLVRGGERPSGDSHEHHEEGSTTYTCSMHPQIRQDEPGNCPICGMELIPTSQVKNGESSPYVLEMTPEAVAMANVSTVRVKSEKADGKISLNGKVKVNEQRIKSLTANYPGRIEELYVNFTGQEVKKGEKLASIYSPELINSQKELLEAAKFKERQPGLYEAAREKLRSWKINEEQISAIEVSGKVKSNFDILSDIDGVVWARNVSKGDFVSRGSSMFDLVDLSRVWIVLDAYEKHIQHVRTGDPLTFKVSALSGEEFSARVAFIHPILEEATRTISVRAEIANPGGRLKPGMIVRGEINASLGGNGGLVIPKSSVLWTGPRSVVFTQVGTREAPAFEMKEVELGSSLGDQFLVLSGIEEGDELVSQGTFSIDAAAQLSGNYSMMLRPEVLSLDVPDSFREQFMAVIHAYLELKDAFVESDVQKIRSHIPNVLTKWKELEADQLDSKAKEVWEDISMHLPEIMDKMTKADDIEAQRVYFEDLSDHLIEAVERYGVIGTTLYRQFCPMAFDNKGAYWLSDEEQIMNPYWGDKMLTCGEVRATYKPGEKVTKDPGHGDQSHQNHNH